jgi:poly-beta-1,6-N-acetyl-D-glucosamine synthase
MLTWTEIALLATLLLFVYPFAIYPALLLLLVRSKPRAAEPSGDVESLPSAVLIICALNEQKMIRQKIENSLALDYPAGKLRIVAVSDGSSDATAAIARESVPQGIELIEREQRRGKVANLNEVIAQRTEDVIVLSDANVIYDRHALLFLMENLRDPAVGCVSGKVALIDTTKSLQASEQSYYSLEWTLQEKASAIHSMAGADGAMYAFRRKLFRPCPPDTLIEDFVLPLAIVRQGYRAVFEPRATAWESGVTGLHEEFRRKTRIAAGAAQALLRGNGWPLGAPLSFWFVFVSHKLLRWFSPWTGLAMLLLAALSLPSLFGAIVCAGFGAVLLAALLRWAGVPHRLLDAPFYFLFGQAALLLGLCKGIAGRQSVLWAKVDR